MKGRYIAFITEAIAGSSNYENKGLVISSMAAFGSANLVVDATLEQEPDRTNNGMTSAPWPSFSNEMATNTPRFSILSPSYTNACTEYGLSVADSTQNVMSFKLDEATYVQYVHATGDGYNG